MKERLGFVSNSSSSSFLIYGVCISESTLIKVYNTINGSDESEDSDVPYLIEKELGVESHHVPDDDYYFFGISPDSIRDDQTGAEFKKEVRDKLLKYFPDPSNFSYHSEAWHNG